MTDPIEEVRLMTADAIRLAVTELRSQPETANLFGFALCTDSDVSTLYHVACTRDWVAQRELKYKDIGYIYVEWVLVARNAEAQFDKINDRLCHLEGLKYDEDVDVDDEGYVFTREQRFEALVMGMKDCRDAGLFDADTLLCIGDTDGPGRAEMDAADRLNKRDVADRFAKALRLEKYRHEEPR